MKKLMLVALLLAANYLAMGQITDPKATEVWEPEPRVVTPGQQGGPPSDAIILFDGTHTDAWMHRESGKPVEWKLDKAAKTLTVASGTKDIMTKQKFGSMQLHIEWRTPVGDPDSGQDRGNSGIFLQQYYEVQVLDNYNNRTYSNGQASAIYKQSIPLVNACRPPGEWQTYDIIYQAPYFDQDGRKVRSAYVTVIHNGVLVQNHVEIKGTTEYIGLPKNIPHGDLPIILQDHDNAVSYRNIWVREL